MRSLPLNPQETVRRPLRVVPNAAAAEATASPAKSIRRIASQALLDGSRELVIEHQGNEYHLRLTRNDKLILTK